MSKMIVVSGDVVSGLKFTGPFNNQAELTLYMNTLSDYEAERVVVADLDEFPLPEPVVEGPVQFLVREWFVTDQGELDRIYGAFETAALADEYARDTMSMTRFMILKVET